MTENYFPLGFSDHAREAMNARRVSREEVLDIVRHPEIVEPSGRQRRFVKDGLVVVLGPNGRRWEVVTVLLRQPDQWTNEDARKRPR